MPGSGDFYRCGQKALLRITVKMISAWFYAAHGQPRATGVSQGPGSKNPCERIASGLPHRRWLFFFFLHRPLGVGQDLLRHRLGHDVVVVHFHAVAAFALGHAG